MEYRRGKDNLAADALSRVSHKELCALTLSSISTQIMGDIKKTWEADPTLQQLITELIKDAS